MEKSRWDEASEEWLLPFFKHSAPVDTPNGNKRVSASPGNASGRDAVRSPAIPSNSSSNGFLPSLATSASLPQLQQRPPSSTSPPVKKISGPNAMTPVNGTSRSRIDSPYNLDNSPTRTPSDVFPSLLPPVNNGRVSTGARKTESRASSRQSGHLATPTTTTNTVYETPVKGNSTVVVYMYSIYGMYIWHVCIVYMACIYMACIYIYGMYI